MQKIFQFVRRITDTVLRFAAHLPFRKKGLGYVSIAVVLFLLLLAGYIFSGVLQKLEVPIETIPAVEYTSGEGFYATGYVVRQETVLTAPQAITSLVLSEGQKAAAFQTVAMSYDSVDAQQRQRQIQDLSDQLTQLQYAAGSSATADRAAMDAQIRDELVNMAVLLGKGRISAVANAAPELKGLILRRNMEDSDLAAIQSQIAETEDKITQLRKNLSGSVSIITSPKAGYFSGTTDGYESVLTPEAITSMSVKQAEAPAVGAVPAGAIGKVISGDEWFYMAVVPSAYVEKAKLGQTVTVTFAQETTAGSIPMKISHIGPDEDGKAVLVLSCSHYLQDMTMMRQQNADIVFSTQSGLRVPKEAVRVMEDGRVGVFILESTRADFKPVDILMDNGETYLVALDKSSTDYLWPGDEVIVSGVEDLYDDKVVR